MIFSNLLDAKKFKVRSNSSVIVQSVSESLSMKWNRPLRSLTGKALYLRLNVTVQLVKETGTGFGLLLPIKMAHKSCCFLSSSASS